MEELYSVELGYFVAGVLVKDGIIKDAAPILRWAIGKKWEEVKIWAEITKYGKITLIVEDLAVGNICKTFVPPKEELVEEKIATCASISPTGKTKCGLPAGHKYCHSNGMSLEKW